MVVQDQHHKLLYSYPDHQPSVNHPDSHDDDGCHNDDDDDAVQDQHPISLKLFLPTQPSVNHPELRIPPYTALQGDFYQISFVVHICL